MKQSALKLMEESIFWKTIYVHLSIPVSRWCPGIKITLSTIHKAFAVALIDETTGNTALSCKNNLCLGY